MKKKVTIITDFSVNRRAVKQASALAEKGFFVSEVNSRNLRCPFFKTVRFLSFLLRKKPEIVQTDCCSGLAAAILYRLFSGVKIIVDYPEYPAYFPLFLADRIICRNHLEKSDAGILIEDLPECFRKFTKDGLFSELSLDRAKHKLIVYYCNPLYEKQSSIRLFIETARILRYNPQLYFIFLTDINSEQISAEIPADSENIFCLTAKTPVFDQLKDASAGIISDESAEKNWKERLFTHFTCGVVAVITGNESSAADTVTKLQTGVICNQKDPVELAKTILSLIYDHQLYPVLRKNCTEVSEEHCWENTVRSYTDIFDSVSR